MAELVKTNKVVTFGRGLYADYDSSVVDIYFATDQLIIYMDNKPYGSDVDEIQSLISSIIGGGEGLFLQGIEKDLSGNLIATYNNFGIVYNQISELPEGETATSVTSLDEAAETGAKYVSITTGEAPDETTTYYEKDYVNVSEKLALIQAEIAEFKVKSVSSSDKVLSNEDGVISTTIDLTYDSDKKELHLVGKNNQVIGTVDATQFLKDGMIDVAEIVDVTEKDGKFVYGDDDTEAKGVTAEGKYIHLSFNTDAEKSDIYLSVTEILSAYKEGKDIDIKSDNSINVSLDEDITMLGTTWGQYGTGHTIKAGTSLSEILKEILIKVINVTVVNPTLSINVTKDPDQSNYEIGDEVSISLSGTYYDGKFTGTTSDGYKSGTGNGSNYTTQPAGCEAGDITFLKDNVTLASNTDTINITESGVTYKSQVTYQDSTNTPIKNNGTESDKSISGATINSSNVTIKGYYKYYIGYNSWLNANDKTSDDIKTLTDKVGYLNSTSVTVFNSDQTSGDGNSIIIAYPTTYSLKSIDSTLGASILNSFETYTVSYTNGNSTVDYTIAILPNQSSDAIAFKNLVIGK